MIPFNMSRVGAQLMTVREYAKTPAEIRDTFKKVAEIGYETAQVSGLGPISPTELAEISAETNVKIVCTHQSYEDITEDFERLMEEHRQYDCTYIGLGCMPTKFWENRSALSEFIESMNRAAHIAKKGGFDLGYHNHNFEFSRIDGERIIDILLREFDPHISIVYDTYWVQHGGADVADWLRRLSGRVKMLHLKDMDMEGRTTQFMTEILEGNLNFDGIFKAAEETDVQYYLVEQDTCRRNPFESLKISFDNIKNRYGRA